MNHVHYFTWTGHGFQCTDCGERRTRTGNVVKAVSDAS